MHTTSTAPSIKPPKTYQKLMDAAELAVPGATAQDCAKISHVVQTHLGTDKFCEGLLTEIKAMPEAELGRRIAEKDLGIYDARTYMTRPEVGLALRLAAHESFPHGDAIRPKDRVVCDDGKTVKTLTERFPSMDVARVLTILAL